MRAYKECGSVQRAVSWRRKHGDDRWTPPAHLRHFHASGKQPPSISTLHAPKLHSSLSMQAVLPCRSHFCSERSVKFIRCIQSTNLLFS
jgi:hypothetical protein